MPRAVATLGAGKVNDGAGLLLHKRKDGGAQWLYRYTIHGRRREMGLGALRDVSLKQACECANQWRSVLREGRAPIKEREKQRRAGGCCCGTSWHKFLCWFEILQKIKRYFVQFSSSLQERFVTLYRLGDVSQALLKWLVGQLQHLHRLMLLL